MRGFYGLLYPRCAFFMDFFYPRCVFLWTVLPLDANGNHVVQKCMETAESNASPHMVALLLRIQGRVQTSCSVIVDYCSSTVRLLFDYC
jgi:hypothetical protein